MEVKRNLMSPHNSSDSTTGVTFCTWLEKLLQNSSASGLKCGNDQSDTIQCTESSNSNHCFSPFLRLNSIESATTSATSSDDDVSDIKGVMPAKAERRSILRNVLTIPVDRHCARARGNMEFVLPQDKYCPINGSSNNKMRAGNMYGRVAVGEGKWKRGCHTMRRSGPTVEARRAKQRQSQIWTPKTNDNNMSFTHWLDVRMSQKKDREPRESKERSGDNVVSSHAPTASSYAQALKLGAFGAHRLTDAGSTVSSVGGSTTTPQTLEQQTRYRKCGTQTHSYQPHINNLLSPRKPDTDNCSNHKMSVLHKGRMQQERDEKQYDSRDKLQYRKLFEERRDWLNSMKTSSSKHQTRPSAGADRKTVCGTSETGTVCVGKESQGVKFQIDVRISPPAVSAEEQPGQISSESAADFTITFLDHDRDQDTSVDVKSRDTDDTSEAPMSEAECGDAADRFSMSGSVHFILNECGSSDAGCDDDDNYDSWSSDEDGEDSESMDDQLLLTLFGHSLPLLTNDLLPSSSLHKVASAPELTHLDKLNNAWNQQYSATTPPAVIGTGKKQTQANSTTTKHVHFPSDGDTLVRVHHMVAWRHAYQAARKGPWEEMARDRCRFQHRIQQLGTILSPCFSTSHRQRVYNNLLVRSGLACD